MQQLLLEDPLAAARGNTRALLREFVDWCRPKRLRGLLDFAEAEIVLPTGIYEGLRWRRDMQPFVRLCYEELAAGSYNGLAATGPSQSGKTLCMLVIPVLWHLFEVGETVTLGIPTLEMANDKWARDFRPVIERSRFARLLPTRGPGSRDGGLNGDDPSVRFANGATLKFMSAGGRDKKRAGFTTRVLAITETDDMDAPSETSREGSKIEQLRARTNAYGERRQVYEECTVSIEEGHIWQTYLHDSTASVIEVPCHGCGQWVQPEREHFVGWKEAEHEAQARAAAHFVCPACAAAIDEPARVAMLGRARLTHRRESPRLGFRWSAFHNLFASYSDLAAGEWKASRAPDPEMAEKARRQFYWTQPYRPPLSDSVQLSQAEIIRRTGTLGRGIVRRGATATMFIDLGKRQCHWALLDWYPGASGRVVDYDSAVVESDLRSVEEALLVALRGLRDRVEAGWAMEGESEAVLRPAVVMVDAGYWTETAVGFVAECGAAGLPFVASFGRGVGQQHGVSYSQPKTTGAIIKQIGDHYHLAYLKHYAQSVVEFDADYWKTFLHQRLATPLGADGALELYAAPPNEHRALARHLTAEKRQEEFVPKKGIVTRWHVQSRDNHWLDCAAGCCVAAHLAGIRTAQLAAGDDPSAPTRRRSAVLARGMTRPDGRTW